MSETTTVGTDDATSFRLDIEGLRAIAVGAVLLFHAGFPFAAGGYVGVDVFFVISGFLITNLLIKEGLSENRVRLATFYAKRIRRLLPASVAALIFTAALTLLALPANRWASIAGDVIGSALYMVNWRFAFRSVDYLASESAASPAQHFWSLAVEEQFYLIWPVLIVAGLFAASRLRRSKRATIATLLGLVAVASLAFSVLYTRSSPGPAYFATPTRIWELSVGAAVALSIPTVRGLSRRHANLIGWVGLAAIAVSIVGYGSSTPFPSYTALLPTLGTAMVIVAGVMNSNTGVYRALSIRLAQFTGKISYALYLYHWPIIVVLFYLGGGQSIVLGAVGMVLSFLPAYLSFRFVEAPFRKARKFVSPPRRGLAYGLGLTAVSASAGGLILAFVALSGGISAIDELSQDREAIEAVFASGISDPLVDVALPDSLPATLTPPLTRVVDDNPSIYEEGCHQNQTSDEAVACVFGPESGIPVVLVGDSHAAQWVPALDLIARREGWRLYSYSKSACPFGFMLMGVRGEPYDSCLRWNHNVVDTIVKDIRPDLVITTGSNTNLPLDPSGSTPGESVREALYIEGLTEAVDEIVTSGLKLVLFADTPRPGSDVPECLASKSSVVRCAFSRTEASTRTFQQEVANDLGLGYFDMVDFICAPTLCAPVVDNVIVWRDNSHLTATYSRLLAPALLAQLSNA